MNRKGPLLSQSTELHGRTEERDPPQARGIEERLLETMAFELVPDRKCILMFKGKGSAGRRKKA